MPADSDSDGSSSLIVPTSALVDSSGQPVPSDAEAGLDDSTDTISILRPLAVLVLAPLLLVVTVVVIWLLVRSLL